MEIAAPTVLRCIACETAYEERPGEPVACTACGATGWIAAWVRRDERRDEEPELR